jgi:hypothetical protein
MSFTNVEASLKIILLLISIIYTSMKISDWVITKIKGNKIDNNEIK